MELARDIVRIEGADGNVFYGGGVPYHSIAVRQADSIIVFETPLSPARANEVIDSVQARFGARATSLVVTHAHYDHISGVPAAADRGLRLIVTRRLGGFLRSLPAYRKRPSLIAVDDSLSVGTGDTRFMLYHIPTLHARGMLIAWFPQHRLLVESDMAGLASPTQQRELVDWVRAKGLNVDRIAGTHGPVTTWNDFATKVR